MANAITSIEKNVPNAMEEETQAVEQLLKGAAKHHEALLAFMGVLDELHRIGVLDAARAMLLNKQQIAVIGLNQMNKPGAHRIIKNTMGAVGFLSRLEPSKLQRLMNGVAAGVDRAGGDGSGEKQAGMWGTLKAFREPEVMSTLTLLTNFLRGMGSGLKQPH